MGGVIVDLLTPCLIFGKIVPSFDFLNFQDWVPVFFFTFCKCLSHSVCSFLGFAWGYLLACIFRIKHRSQRNLMAVVIGLAHTGSIQLTLAITLSSTLDEIGGIKNCDQSQLTVYPSEKATSYIVLVWVLSTTMRWSIGYSMLAPQ